MLRESPLLLTLMRRVALVAVLLAFGVVVLGAYVRLTTAGLGCPDWPGCYGHATPTAAAADVGKAWREMIHRYLAGSLVVLTLVLAVLAFMRRHARNSGGASRRLCWRWSRPSSSRRCWGC
jgi:cytochrome c oxidase assembly protein subunit 15